MKKFLCVVLTLALVLAALAGCQSKADPQPESEASEPESSQAAPEPIAPEPIMPVPEAEPEPEEDEPEPEPEDDPAPEEDEEDEEDEDGEDAEDEEGDEEEEEDEEDESGLFTPPAVPHGDDIAWLDFTTVTVDELKPLLDKVLARAEYFCQYGRTGRFTEAGIDKSEGAAITRPYKSYDKWTYYPYTKLPYHTVDELQEAMLTSFTWDVISSDFHYVFESMTDDGERLYYADDILGYAKTRYWDTSKMKILSATERKLTLWMPTDWWNREFDAEMTLHLQDGYLVLDPSYFAISEEERESLIIK